jgi:polyphosphate kinase
MCEYPEAEKYFNKTLLINPTFIEATWQKSYMFMKWEGNTIKSRETVADLMRINESIPDLRIFERTVYMDICDGKYEKVLKDLLSKDFDIIDTHFYFNTKSLMLARVYQLMNMPEKPELSLNPKNSEILKIQDFTVLWEFHMPGLG